MSFLSAFEAASGIDVPDEICGISVPDPELGDLGGIAGDLLEQIGGLDDMVEKAAKVRELVATGAKSAGNCWGVIDQAADILGAIANRMEPLMPLFNPIENVTEVMGLLTKDNLDECVKIVLNILDLGKLLEKIMGVLEGLKEMFANIWDSCSDVIETVTDVIADVAEGFAHALHLNGALDGLSDLMEGVKWLVGELSDVGGVLRPILEAWENASFMEAFSIAADNFDDVTGALQRVNPSWDKCQEHYESSRGMGSGGYEGAKTAFTISKNIVKKVAGVMGAVVPGGFGAHNIDVQPTVGTRGGLPPSQDDSDDDDGGDAGCGPADAPPELRSLFNRFRDGGAGVSFDRFKELIASFGFDEGEAQSMFDNHDSDGDGLLNRDEFVGWLWGEQVCDEDRQNLMTV